ncbi:MAG: PEP-CTERM sorting domain-containing protein [Fimbriimonadales bacterium]|nr:PEP-CTERM sorting domain-containing protein [Fimbriimonadales bacterium]
MKKFVCLLSLVGGVTLASAQVPPNSFFVRPARSVTQLLQQVRQEPVVLDRFMRHFQLSQSELLSYFRTLRTARLPADTHFTVYNVNHETGEIYSKQRTLKRGELVFVEESGRPILWASCGNPLVGPRSDGTTPPAIGGVFTSSEGLKEIALISAGETAPLIELQTMEPSPLLLPDAEFLAPPPALQQPTTQGQQQQEEAPFFIPLTFLPSALIGLNPSPPPVVPEPSALLVLAGATGLLLARRKRHSR